MPTPSVTDRWALPGARKPVMATVATALVLLLVATPAAAVEAQGIRLDATEPSALGAGSVLRPALPPGGTATYDLSLRNQHDESVEVLVYGADVAGEEVASGTDNTGVGAWIAADEPRVVLGPGGEETVPVTITRPDDDSGGGTGAIVAQLSERSRQELGLDVLRRVALRVEVAADGSGQGVHVAVTDQVPSRGLVPGALTVEVTITNPGEEEAAFDSTLHVLRRLGRDASRALATTTLAPGEQVVRRVEVELPWYGVVGRLRAEAATVAVTASSPGARVVVVPPWLVLALLLVAAWAVVRLRRAGRPVLLGRGPGDPPPTDGPPDGGRGTVGEVDADVDADAHADVAADADADVDDGGDGVRSTEDGAIQA